MKSREIAFKVLVDIEDNNNYSNIAINKHFKGLKVDNKEKGLATEIIYGVVEKKLYLDYIIDKLSKIKLNKLSTTVKTLLRIGIYQIAFLDSISDYASVNETVNLVKKYDNRSQGFVNAILRNISRNKDLLEVSAENENMYYSTKYSYSPWMIKSFMSDFGVEFTKDLLEENEERPKMYVRVNTLKTTKKELIEKLNSVDIKCFEVRGIDEAVRVENLRDIENNEYFKDGLFTVQDISSMLVSKVLNPKENSKVLDICSAPGGKTTHMATLMNNTGEVYAKDIFEHKLKLINNSIDRLALTNVSVELGDALIVDETLVDKFDYVLADVPCSGLGIIKRKPEIKYKKKADLNELPKIQKEILQNASKYVKVGGDLVYSTCTIIDKENILVIEEFLKENDNFKLVPIDEVSVDLDNQENGYLKIYPNIHGMDGFFIAKLTKIS
ncbi:MAG: 16S rRNA (cytosine(967)-C(5))-methyltransferase RsmB [Peptostreptococcaceae bacterium]